MEEEIKLIDAEKGILEVITPVRRLLTKEQLLTQKEVYNKNLAKIEELLKKFL